MQLLVTSICVAISCFLIQTSVQAQTNHGHAPGYHKKFSDAKHWVKVFDDPARDKWQLPNEVMEAMSIQPADVIADIGAGTGYFSFRIAKRHPHSKIYAADAEDYMLDFLKAEAKKQNCKNVVPFKIKIANPRLPEKVNIVLVVNTFHHIDNRVQYFKVLKTSLAERARVVIIDFTTQSPVGPPEDHRIDRAEVIAELKESGFALKKENNFLPNQYFLEFETRTLN